MVPDALKLVINLFSVLLCNCPTKSWSLHLSFVKPLNVGGLVKAYHHQLNPQENWRISAIPVSWPEACSAAI